MKYPILILCALGALTSGLRAQEELFLGVTPASVGVLDLASDKFLFYNIGEAEGSRKANITGLVLKTEFQLTTPTDLAGGTTLAVQKDYFDTVSADRTFAALPAGANGDKIYLTFDVTGATRALNFHTNSTVYRVGESGALAAAISFPVGNHTLKLTKEDAKWWITDSGEVSGTYATLTGTETLSAKTVARNGALGTDDTLTGNTITGLLAGATIAQWEAVYIGGSSTYLLADANGSGTYPARGLAVSAYSSTNAATIVTNGTVRNDAWAWTPGGTIYLSTTAGGLTQTIPATTGDKIQVIGYALTADIMMVAISPDFGTSP